MIWIMKIPAPFNSLPPRALRRQMVARGDAVFRQGAPSVGIVLVLFGAVEMVRHHESGQTILLHQAGVGETLAEASLFSHVYHCDCVAAQDAEVVWMEKGAILQLIGRDADFALALTARLARQVQDYRRWLEIGNIKSAQGRVLAALREFGSVESVAPLARRIGLTPEATNRALSALVAAGAAVRLGRGRYALKPFGNYPTHKASGNA
jgi:CRP-like cAMP-binding protein